VERIKGATAWLESHGYRGVLGEFAGGDNATCRTAVTGMLTYIANHRDAWMGWTWWAAGPWWGYQWYTLEPNNLGSANPQNQPQLAWLLPFEK
jgi:endoglucanase